MPLSKGAHVRGGRQRLANLHNRAVMESSLERSEAALRESEANLKRAQEIDHFDSWSMDYVNNRLIVSDEVLRIFGGSPEDPATYESILSVIHPDDRQAVDRV
jgi:hypothetical protein